MCSHKATLTIIQNKLKAIDQYHMQNSSEKYWLMITGQEKNFSYGVNAANTILSDQLHIIIVVSYRSFKRFPFYSQNS